MFPTSTCRKPTRPPTGAVIRRIDQIQLYVIHVRLVRANRAFQLADQRFLRVILLLRDDALLEQTVKSFRVELSISQCRLVFVQSSFCLAQGHLIRPGVDHSQKVALLYFLAFAKMDLY